MKSWNLEVERRALSLSLVFPILYPMYLPFMEWWYFTSPWIFWSNFRGPLKPFRKPPRLAPLIGTTGLEGSNQAPWISFSSWGFLRVDRWGFEKENLTANRPGTFTVAEDSKLLLSKNQFDCVAKGVTRQGPVPSPETPSGGRGRAPSDFRECIRKEIISSP